jgi:hypothetical protein
VNRKERRARDDGQGGTPRRAVWALSVVGVGHRLAVAGLLVLPLLWSGCAAPRAGGPPLDAAAAPPAEILDAKYLFEIVRHVYRWHLDENDVDRLSGTRKFPFWVRVLDTPLDAGDRSRTAEIVMPLVGTVVKVKKADYRIDELNLAVTSSTYRITSVSKIGIPDKPLPSHRVVNVNYAAMRAYLFETRAEATFPDEALRERLRVAVRQQMGLRPEARNPGRQIAHLAPLSPVANEAWVYLENQRLLVRFASDIELVNPAVWAHEALMIRTWDVRNQVVVSLDEAAGSNAFMTRAQIGRALYNCIVLGQRLEVTNPEAESDEAATAGESSGK